MPPKTGKKKKTKEELEEERRLAEDAARLAEEGELESMSECIACLRVQLHDALTYTTASCTEVHSSDVHSCMMH